MESGGFETRSAAPSAPHPASHGVVAAVSAGFGVAFLAAVAVSVAQFSILLAR